MAMSGIPPRPPLAELQSKARWLALLLLAIGLHVFESALPGLGPWFKPGLANIMTLLALVWLGPKAAASLAVARVVLGSLLIGTLFTPTFIMSLAGALAAAAAMIMMWRLQPVISVIGISLVAAVTHMLAQFTTVEVLFIQQAALYHVLPGLLLLSAITGWLNGAVATYIIARIRIKH